MVMEPEKVSTIASSVKEKVVETQNGIPTFFDNLIINHSTFYLNNISKDYSTLERAITTLDLKGGERFVDLSKRVKEYPFSDLDAYSRVCSQGVLNCIKWRNKPLFKSSQDFVIYNLLIAELRPSTIIEIGSTEGSLFWLNDICLMNNIEVDIIGFDKRKLPYLDARIKTYQGDLANIESILTKEILSEIKHPVLIIEDAHMYIGKVINYLKEFLLPNDYFIIEDSISKQNDILDSFINDTEGKFLVDTYYTDFFGINTVSSVNSILKKI
ncbi:CmcI family methyltransferase [Cytobacillus horneckiae]|uniref:CmcI family methyltransferase n=1 Tax=Cytobacillus horneckiae TaxID=549687 RepID=UPI0039A1EFD6